MSRREFIEQLYNNGDGLTLDQIQSIEEVLADTIPEGVETDIEKDLGEDATPEGILESALYIARDVFINNMQDCPDMLALRDFIRQYADNVTDQQIYGLYYIR